MKIAGVLVGLACLMPSAAGWQQDAYPKLVVGPVVAGRGEKVYGELPVPAGTDAGTTIPVALIHGARQGKIVAFVAGSHGTEYASTVALTRLIDRIDPATLSGSVIIAPLLNVASFEQMTVHTNPIDRKGMNAGYPGSKDGTQTERALAMVTGTILEVADVVVDLHGGDLDEDLRPYSYLTRTGNAEQDEAAQALVAVFGLDHIIVRDIDVTNPASTRSLSGYSLSRGKTAIVAEAGRSGTVLPEDVDALINGSLNVLGSLKLIDRAVAIRAKFTYVSGGSRVAAEKPVMFFASVKRDTVVTENQVIGYTTDYLGRKIGDVRAPVAGLVTFIRGVPSTWTGATLVNVSPILPSVPPYKKPG
jgi:uncharacterized protein